VALTELSRRDVSRGAMLNREIKLVTDIEELSGTDYFEFLPREYSGVCWNPDSVFLDEEVFTLIEPIFEKNVPSFDHYAFQLIEAQAIEGIIQDLRTLLTSLPALTPDTVEEVLSMMFVNSAENFRSDFEINKIRTIKMIESLVDWLQKVAKDTDRVTILGM